MAHNMLGFINILKKDVNNLMRADEKKFRAKNFSSRARVVARTYTTREKFFADAFAMWCVLRGERRRSVIEGCEDPAVVMVYAVVGDDGVALAAAGDAYEGAVAVGGVVIAVGTPAAA